MKKIIPIFIIIVLICSLCIGCSKGSYVSPSIKDSYYVNPNSDELFNGKTDSQNQPGNNIPQENQSELLLNRKVIKNASLTAETLEYAKFIELLENEVNNIGGYIQSNVEYNNRDLRTADIKIRIPAEHFDNFIKVIDGLSNITNKNIDVSDITDTYVDIYARLASLRTEYDTLLNLLKQADSLETIITLQDRLANVRYEIESYEARKRTYDSQIAYSTISIHIIEVERETVVEKEGFGAEVSRRFKESLKDVGEGFRNFAAWFIGELPHILVFITFVFGIPAIIVIIIIKSIKKKKIKKAKEQSKSHEV